MGKHKSEYMRGYEDAINDVFSSLGKAEMKIVKDLTTGKNYEFIEYVQQEVEGCTFVDNTPHAKVKELDSKGEKYIPINQIEFQ